MNGAARGFSADEVLPCGMSVAAQGFSAYTDAGTELRPAAAYPGLGPGLKLISAIVDSVLWDDPAWAYAVLAWAFGERQPRTSTQTERFFADHGWRDVDDVLQAAGLSARQSSVYVGCELERLESLVMADRLGI
jgi:hypothetical protein